MGKAQASVSSTANPLRKWAAGGLGSGKRLLQGKPPVNSAKESIIKIRRVQDQGVGGPDRHSPLLRHEQGRGSLWWVSHAKIPTKTCKWTPAFSWQALVIRRGGLAGQWPSHTWIQGHMHTASPANKTGRGFLMYQELAAKNVGPKENTNASYLFFLLLASLFCLAYQTQGGGGV